MVNPMPNFRARKQRSGKIYYYFDTGKTSKEIPLGADYHKAVERWLELSTRIDLSPIKTFADLAAEYSAKVLPEKAGSTQATQRGDIKKLQEFFCNPHPAPLNEIKPKHIYQLLQWSKNRPTTANRLKRVFSHMFNMARAWGWTENENPCAGIEGFALGKREVYITDAVYQAVYAVADDALRDAMDLAYLTGQRPGDVRNLTTRNIQDGRLVIKQSKTAAPLRFIIEGELQNLLQRIAERKDSIGAANDFLLVSTNGLPMTKQMLRDAFEPARATAADRAKAAENLQLADEIRKFWFYDLRAKAADDVADDRGEQAAADQLGHASVQTTKRHYLRRGPQVRPTK